MLVPVGELGCGALPIMFTELELGNAIEDAAIELGFGGGRSLIILTESELGNATEDAAIELGFGAGRSLSIFTEDELGNATDDGATEAGLVGGESGLGRPAVGVATQEKTAGSLCLYCCL